MFIYKDNTYPHLSEEPTRERTSISADKPNEAFCTACGARVTIGEQSGSEYGHGRGCPNRQFDNAVSATNQMAEEVCGECGAGFPSEEDLSNHEQSSHGGQRAGSRAIQAEK